MPPDFKELLQRQVDNLERNTAEARAELYRQARDDLWVKYRDYREDEFWNLQDALERAINDIELARHKRSGKIARWLQGIMGRTIEKRLKFFIEATGALVTVGLFWSILQRKIEYYLYFRSLIDLLNADSWFAYFRDKGGITILSILVIWIFVAGQQSAKTELDIALSLFSQANTPKEWTKVRDHKSALLQIVAYLLLFLGLAEFVDDMRYFAAGLTGLFLINLRIQFTIQKNMRRYFADKRFLPPKGDPHEAFILRRRQVITQYFRKPHKRKEGAVVAASFAALLLAWGSHIYGRDAGILPTVIVAIALAGNEVILMRWRRVRARRLQVINDDQELSDRLRIGEVSAG